MTFLSNRNDKPQAKCVGCMKRKKERERGKKPKKKQHRVDWMSMWETLADGHYRSTQSERSR